MKKITVFCIALLSTQLYVKAGEVACPFPLPTPTVVPFPNSLEWSKPQKKEATVFDGIFICESVVYDNSCFTKNPLKPVILNLLHNDEEDNYNIDTEIKKNKKWLDCPFSYRCGKEENSFKANPTPLEYLLTRG